jgi:hypothetical protein
MSEHTSYGAAATSDPTRELRPDELDQIAGGTPSIPIPPPAPNSGGVFTVTEHMRRIYTKL